MRAAKMQIVREMPAARREVAADNRMRDDRLTLLRRRERTHQCEAGAFLVLEQARALEGAAVRIGRLRSQKGWCQHHLAAQHEATQGEVMTE
jgi:hypothetical protein